MAERKSIYDDLEVLRHYGLDISIRKSKTTDYFVACRLFELPELKLLVDAVQCSKFVTHKKSNELIKKIESLASTHQAMSLHRQVYVSNRVKTINESIYYNVDRMSDIELSEAPREALPENEHFNIAEYSKKVFNMFGGEEVTVKLKFDNSLVNAVIDRFGKDIMIGKLDNASFSIWIKVALSSTFYAWLAQFGNKVKILSPEMVIEKYRCFITEIINEYE